MLDQFLSFFSFQLRLMDWKEIGREEAKAKAKYGGLSTAPWTVKLSMASVEMTIFVVGEHL
jgi:hypothetical protein